MKGRIARNPFVFKLTLNTCLRKVGRYVWKRTTEKLKPNWAMIAAYKGTEVRIDFQGILSDF